MKNNSWQEEAWEQLLQAIWDNRKDGEDSIEYTKKDLDPILSKYTKSGQGEIRIFHSSSNKIEALKKRGLVKIPLSRVSWKVIKGRPGVIFTEPEDSVTFSAKNEITEGMLAGIKDTMILKSSPGETTLLAIANYTGIIADFYSLTENGVLFTGGRQSAGIHLIVDNKDIDMTKAQIEIDGGFEWPENVVIVEVKSSFKQDNFDINQALIPMLKWKSLLKNKKVNSMVLLAETNTKGIEYRAYDFVRADSELSTGMRIARSKKYILEIK